MRDGFPPQPHGREYHGDLLLCSGCGVYVGIHKSKLLGQALQNQRIEILLRCIAPEYTAHKVKVTVLVLVHEIRNEDGQVEQPCRIISCEKARTKEGKVESPRPERNNYLLIKEPDHSK